jgi:dienelactone hydrolase
MNAIRVLLLNSSLALLGVLMPGNASATGQVITEKLVTFDGVVLGAFLTLPPGEPQGTVVILQGSGNVAADGDVSGVFLGSGYQGQPAKVGEQMAETLAMLGIASIRYHKRGFEDAAELPHQTLDYLQKDAEAALEFMRLRFPGKKQGVVGYSEGALLALLIAAKQPLDAIFLFAPPTQGIDQALQYQFHEHPLKLLRERFDVNQDGVIAGDELVVLTASGLPVLNIFGLTWSQLDLNQDGVLSLQDEAVPGYTAGLLQVMDIVNTTMKPWYESLKALPNFSAMAKAVSTTPVYCYQGLQDAQVDASFVGSAVSDFPLLGALRLYPELGHGFAPMQGFYGEVKTSGPYQPEVLDDLALDIRKAFN